MKELTVTYVWPDDISSEFITSNELCRVMSWTNPFDEKRELAKLARDMADFIGSMTFNGENADRACALLNRADRMP